MMYIFYYSINLKNDIMLQLAEEKVKIINVGLLGLAFMLAFTAFNVSIYVT